MNERSSKRTDATNKKSSSRSKSRHRHTTSQRQQERPAPVYDTKELDELSDSSDEGIPKRLNRKGDPWTIHVTWDVLNEPLIQYTLRKKAIILSPMSYNSPYAMQFVQIENKNSKLNKRIFKPIMRHFPPNVVYTGQWETAKDYYKVPGVIINTNMMSSTKKHEVWQRFSRLLAVDIPDDDNLRRQAAYGYLVGKFLELLYDKMKGDAVKVVFHGVETAPCYLGMNHTRYYDYMQMVYLMHQPVLQGYTPKTPGHAPRKADQMHLRWQYELERATLDTIDHLLTTMDPSMSYWILKRQYRRVPDLFFDQKGKNDVLPVQLRRVPPTNKTTTTTTTRQPEPVEEAPRRHRETSRRERRV